MIPAHPFETRFRQNDGVVLPFFKFPETGVDIAAQVFDDEIAAIARFASSLPGVRELHLLPYHRLGQDKYTGLGRKYLMEGIEPPTNEIMASLVRAAKRAAPNLHVQIGG